MIFTQLVFALFFAVVFGVHWALRSHVQRKWWLLVSSYFFYGYWDYRFLALILFCTTVDFFTAKKLEKVDDPQRRKLLIVASMAVNLGVLGFFKYYNFFVDSAVALLRSLGAETAAPSLEVVLPVGISFFTFQSMSYTIDVYRRELRAQKHFSDFALYVSFFPQLVAGPIVRAKDFLPQLATNPRWVSVEGRRALALFALGYFKKACVADNIAHAIDPMFQSPANYDASSRALGAFLYSVQIYADFSGYSDMAIAIAGVFGYRLTKNFDAPYFSRSVQEFWQRWHISLSTWLRDYLYISLGGNRGGKWKMYRNLMLTMLLGGLWHGANWTFVLWGAMHGAALVVHRALRHNFAPLRDSRPWQALGWLATLAWVVVCFTIFRASNIEVAWSLFTASPSLDEPGRIWSGWWLITLGLGAIHYVLWRGRKQVWTWVDTTTDFVFYTSLGAATSLWLYLTPQNLAPFIYFQF